MQGRVRQEEELGMKLYDSGRGVLLNEISEKVSVLEESKIFDSIWENTAGKGAIVWEAWLRFRRTIGDRLRNEHRI